MDYTPAAAPHTARPVDARILPMQLEPRLFAAREERGHRGATCRIAGATATGVTARGWSYMRNTRAKPNIAA